MDERREPELGMVEEFKKVNWGWMRGGNHYNGFKSLRECSQF
jgi:hypothetical protein